MINGNGQQKMRCGMRQPQGAMAFSIVAGQEKGEGKCGHGLNRYSTPLEFNGKPLGEKSPAYQQITNQPPSPSPHETAGWMER